MATESTELNGIPRVNGADKKSILFGAVHHIHSEIHSAQIHSAQIHSARIPFDQIGSVMFR